MKLLIARRLQTTTHDPEGNKGLRQTLGHISVMSGEDSIYENMCIERPKIKKLPTVSRLPAGEYSYRIINKTPESPFSFIRIIGSGFDIKCVDDYTEMDHGIMVGEDLVLENTHYNLSNQRKVLTDISKLLPEEGTLVIKDEVKRNIFTEVLPQEQTQY